MPSVSIVLKTSGGSTKGLISHLLSAHHIVIPSSNNRAQPTKRQRTDSALTTRSYRDDSSSSLSDGLPLIAFEKSEDLRRLMNRAGLQVPISHNTIALKLIEYCDNIKHLMTNELEQLFRQTQRSALRNRMGLGPRLLDSIVVLRYHLNNYVLVRTVVSRMMIFLILISYSRYVYFNLIS